MGWFEAADYHLAITYRVTKPTSTAPSNSRATGWTRLLHLFLFNFSINTSAPLHYYRRTKPPARVESKACGFCRTCCLNSTPTCHSEARHNEHVPFLHLITTLFRRKVSSDFIHFRYQPFRVFSNQTLASLATGRYFKVRMDLIGKRGNCNLQEYLWKMVITGYKNSHLKRSVALSFTFPSFLVNFPVQASRNNLNWICRLDAFLTLYCIKSVEKLVGSTEGETFGG